MDGLPRASKRRKLDTPSRVASSPLAKSSSARKSGRASNRSVSYTNGAKEKDVWDDIEGALGESPPKLSDPKTRASAKKPEPANPSPLKRRKEGTGSGSNATDELQSATSTPKKGKRITRVEASSRKSFGRLVNGFKHGAEVEADSQDALENEISSPAKRVYSSITSPRRSGRFWEGSTILETEDELEIPKTASARRRANRVDHVNNRSEAVADDSNEEQADAGAEVNGEAMSVDGDSVMGSVLDPTEPSPFNKPASAQKEKPVLPLLHGHLGPSRESDLLKTIVLERISGKRPAPLIGLDEEYKSVHQLIEHTITAGEGNSMLLISARGSGKTALVNKVLTEISKDNSEDYHVVRLNGFIHTDDKIALREIWRQLGKEMNLEEDGGGVGKNYADTLTTLLALLSHPSEQTGEITDHVAKAVIFIMDEFDLFAQHPRQTLLYNLFDIAQSRKAPIAVLGLTTRIDVVNSLEKRVKSRFSHRYVHLSLAKTFTAFQEMCKANLTVLPAQLSVEERGILESAVKTPSAKKGKKGGKQNVLSEWNANINALFASKSFLTTHLAPNFYLTKSLPSVLNTFLLPTATLSSSITLPPSNASAPPSSKLILLPHLSTLSLSLLISAARLDIIHDSDTCNFNMAYDEYVTLASKARIQSAAGGASASGSMAKVWGKDVARREWEGLIELGLVIPVVGGEDGGGFGMVRVDVALEEIGAVLSGEKSVERGLERWCKSL